MEPENWKRIQTLFEELLDLPPDARDPFLNEHCRDEYGAGDPELRGTLEAMLDSSEIDDDFLISPVETASGREPPRILGDFELIEEIGRGGMGVVYRARQTSLGRVVAVKVLPQGWFQSPRQIERFQLESRAGGRLGHPGIVTVYAEGKVEDSYYFAMEYLGGPTLEQLIRDRRSGEKSRWPQESELLRHPAGIARLMAGVAEALHAAHSAGITHRDVKPSNLIMAPGGWLKLGDFGLVLDDRSASMSQTGEVIGSPHYMSPEQAGGGSSRGSSRGPGNDPGNDSDKHPSGVDHRTDIYSLGAVLYELLAGERPFKGDRVVEILRDVVDAAPRPVRSVQPKVPHDLAIICEVAMAKRPADRYATAAELAADLRRALALEPIHARPLPRIRRVLRWTRRHRAPLWTAAAAVVSAVALGSLYLEETLQVQIADQLATLSKEADAPAVASWNNESIEIAGQARTAINVALAGLEDHGPDLNSQQREVLQRSTEALRRKSESMSQAGGDLIADGLFARTRLEPWRTDPKRLLRGATLVHEGNLLRQSLGLDTSDVVELVRKKWVVRFQGVDTGAPADDANAPVAWLHEFDRLTGIPNEPIRVGTCPGEFFTSTGHYLLAIRTPGRPVVEFDRVVWATSDAVSVTVPPSSLSGDWTPDMVKLVPEPVTYQASDSRMIPLEGIEFTLAPFWIDRVEVCNEDYAEFVEHDPTMAPHFWKDSANVHKDLPRTKRNYREDWGRLPVVDITPLQARAYAEWRGLRLPTLAEHMYAARGPHARTVPWCESDAWDGTYLGNCSQVLGPPAVGKDRLADYLKNVVRVDEFPEAATPDGVLHLLGNVTEMTATLKLMPIGDGTFRCSPNGRLIHGGAWYIGHEQLKQDLTSAFAPMGGSPSEVDHRIGFRCARSH